MKTIIFDFGNVVGFFDHQRTLAKVAPFTDMSREEMIQAVYQGRIEIVLEKGHVDVSAALRQVKSLWRARCDEAFLESAIGDIFEPNPEICELIPRLAANYRLLLGSNTNAIHARQFRGQFADVLGHLHHLVLSHEIGARKPEAAFFEECLRHAVGRPDECVFIDDLPANIEGARSLGMKTILYQPNDGVLKSLRDVGVTC